MNKWWMFVLIAAGAGAGCSSDGEVVVLGDSPAAALLRMACEDALDSVYQAQERPANWTPAMRGEVTRCAFERAISIEEMQEAFAVSDAFIDPGITTPIYKFRVQYWMERKQGEPVLTSAALYIPETRRADPSPLVVIGHGSVGIADKCSPSLEGTEGFHKDWRVLVYSYAGDGWVSIMPDNPGLGTPGTTGWLSSLDEGHAVLDATRAARQLFRSGALTEKNAFIGHSAGGHAVLSAQAYAATYGLEGSLETVIPINPFWYSAGSWGALVSPVGVSLLDSTRMSGTMQYFMGHLAVYEGEEAVLDAFLPEKRQAAREMMEGGCWLEITSDEQGPPSIGVDVGADLFLPEYVDEVGVCGAVDDCQGELALSWREIWVADRPSPDTSIPIVQWTGDQDGTTPPDIQKCGLDRLSAQGARLTACVQRDADHAGTVPKMAQWTRQHLEQVLLGGDGPEPCETFAEVFPTLTECGIPIIPNSTDPADP